MTKTKCLSELKKFNALFSELEKKKVELANTTCRTSEYRKMINKERKENDEKLFQLKDKYSEFQNRAEQAGLGIYLV